MKNALFTGCWQLGYNAFQFIAAALVSSFLYLLFTKIKPVLSICKDSAWLIPLFSLAGMALPLGIYGIIPIAVILLYAGFAPYLVIALISSNWLFNMLVPDNSLVFLWSNSIVHLSAAFLAGVLSAIAAKHIFKQSLKKPFFHTFNIRAPIKSRAVWIRFLAFLVIGSIAGPFFRDHLYRNLMNFLVISPLTSPLFIKMGGMSNINTPFILCLTILENMMNLSLLSGLLFLYRKRGVAIHYLSYFVVIVLLVIISLFI
ncbi:MAG: hypothetical protein LBB91_09565 [Clostridiales bacterium]|jgi:hypothetical protein|nr:hypothetical protein [Clostridiales bacterium]